MRRFFLVAISALPVLAPHLSAHHSFAAEYDEKKIVAISGTVRKLTWDNPHVWLYVDTKDAHGKTVRWSFEMGAPGGLLRRGWKEKELHKGDKISVDGYAAKNGSNTANARTITMPDGRKLFGGFQETPGNPFK